MIELRRDWSETVLNIQKEMGRLMDEVVSRKPPTVRFAPRTWQPAIDVYETDGEVVVLVELAGVRENEIEVTVHSGVLTIRGERKDIKQGIKRTYSRVEIQRGVFERAILLPAHVNVEETKALYGAGILEVVLPKSAKQNPRRVDIKGD